jgi:hypothetical protein
VSQVGSCAGRRGRGGDHAVPLAVAIMPVRWLPRPTATHVSTPEAPGDRGLAGPRCVAVGAGERQRERGTPAPAPGQGGPGVPAVDVLVADCPAAVCWRMPTTLAVSHRGPTPRSTSAVVRSGQAVATGGLVHVRRDAIDPLRHKIRAEHPPCRRRRRRRQSGRRHPRSHHSSRWPPTRRVTGTPRSAAAARRGPRHDKRERAPQRPPPAELHTSPTNDRQRRFRERPRSGPLRSPGDPRRVRCEARNRGACWDDASRRDPRRT